MTAERQRRGAGAFIEDTWKKKDGTPKARNGIGHRWRVHVTNAEGERSGQYFARKVDAEAYRDDVKSRLVRGAYISESAGNVTVGELHAEWVQQQGNIAKSTRATRAVTWDTWVSERWKDVLVRDVRKSAVRTWVAEMIEDGAKPATVENALGVLRMVLALGVEEKRLVENPVSGVKPPPRSHKARAYLSHDQVWDLADAVDPRYHLLVLFLCYMGLRFGEAAALEVRDVDLTRRLVHVRQQVTEVEGVLTWTPTKGKKRRHVPVPKFLVEPLRGACEGKAQDAQVFTAPKGGTLRLNSWRDRTWDAAIAKLQAEDEDGNPGTFPDMTPHDSRHTAASLAVSDGANVKAVQRMLGHESAAMTLDRYADLFPDDLDAVAAAFDRSVEAMLKRRQASTD